MCQACLSIRLHSAFGPNVASSNHVTKGNLSLQDATLTKHSCGANNPQVPTLSAKFYYGGQKVAVCFSDIRTTEKQILCFFDINFFFLLFCYLKSRLNVCENAFSTSLLPESRLSPYTGRRKVSICFSAIRIVEKQMITTLKLI